MTVSTNAQVAANTAIRLEFIKAPEKTPFVVTLATKAAGASQNEAVWNDCPSNKVRCDASGTKSHATKRAGYVAIQAGVNWAVTNVSDDGAKTLVTWTNNLSREVLTLRLSK